MRRPWSTDGCRGAGAPTAFRRHHVAPRHPGQTQRTRTAGEAEQDRLGLIVEGVSEQHGLGPDVRRRPGEGVVARPACRRLGAVRGADVNRDDPGGQAQRGGHARGGRGDGIRSLLQTVVDDDRLGPDAAPAGFEGRRGRQRERVGTAREGDQDGPVDVSRAVRTARRTSATDGSSPRAMIHAPTVAARRWARVPGRRGERRASPVGRRAAVRPTETRARSPGVFERSGLTDRLGAEIHRLEGARVWALTTPSSRSPAAAA